MGNAQRPAWQRAHPDVLFLPLLLLVLSALLASPGCSSARRTAPLREPLDRSDPTLVRGEEVFMRKCNKCHPQGDAGLGPGLANKSLVPTFGIKFQVRNGLGAMPSFSDKEISSEDLDAILTYLRAVQHSKKRE